MDTVTLYELGAELNELQDELVANDGELTPELESQLDHIELEFTIKAERVAKMVRIFEARATVVEGQAAAYKDEVSRLNKLATTRSNSAKALKDYLLRWLQATNHRKVQTNLFNLVVTKNTQPSVHFDGDPADLPEALQRVTIELDKKEALLRYKADGKIVSLELPDEIKVEYGYHLRIR